MPIGVIINALSVVIGGILGALVGHKLSPKFKADITLVYLSQHGQMDMPGLQAAKGVIGG